MSGATRHATFCAILLALAAAATPDARADTRPDVWQRAKDPEKRVNYELHREVARILTPSEFPLAAAEQLQWERAREALEQARVMERGDPILMFDLGAVYERLNRLEMAVRVLERGLALDADSAAAEDAWFKLGICYAKLDRPNDERRAYEEYLRRATQPTARSTALLNFAETEMRLGRLAEAITAYREALDYAKKFERTKDTYVLAVWGLAVALDRYGDTTASAREAETAVRIDSYDRLIGDPERVFFVPVYERSWYLGLGAAARSRLAQEPRVALVHAQRAEAQFADYVARARQNDRWKAQAEKHLAAARSERKRLEAHVRTLPKLPQDTEGL